MSKSLPNSINEFPSADGDSIADPADFDTSTVSTAHGTRERAADGSGSDKDNSVYYYVDGDDDGM